MNLRQKIMRRCVPRQRHDGVAAIEFALVFLILFVVFYGLVTFVDVFYKLQAVSRAAEDGARLAQRLTIGGTTSLSADQKLAVENIVIESLAQSSFAEGSTRTARVAWARQNAALVTGSLDSRIVEFRFDYGNNRLLPYIPLADMSTWLLNDDDFSITVKSQWSI